MLKRFAVLILFILALLIPVTAFAQSTPQISSVAISIWPDYDQPSVLVIYHITLAATTTLPAQLSIRIPKDAGSPYAVASKETTGQLLNLQYDLGESAGWSSINFTATQPELQIEYYDPGLVTNGPEHSYTYTWAGDYDVASMSIEIQQPFDATNLRLLPGNATTRSGGDGLTYFIKEVGHVAANEQFSLEIGYTKASSRLSVEDMQIQSTAPLTNGSTWKDSLIGALPWILGILGVAVILGGGFWYWQSGRQMTAVQTPHKRHRSRASRAETETVPAEDAIYCHQCGKRASSSDLFCRSCGARLRSE